MKRKESKKWYLYRNFKTNEELKFPYRNYFIWRSGFRLVKIEDYSVDEKAMKVGGK